MKDAHESLQGQDFCVAGSDAEVRRVFLRLMISFQLQFLQLNLLGRKAITTSDKINLWGVTITLSGLKNKAKSEKKKIQLVYL